MNPSGIQVNMTDVDSPYPVNQKPLFNGTTGADGSLMFQMIPDGHYVWSTNGIKCSGNDVIAIGDTPETQFEIQTSEQTDFLTWFLLTEWVRPGDVQKTRSFLENLARFYGYDLSKDPFPSAARGTNFEVGRLALQWLMRFENYLDTFKDRPSFSDTWEATKNLVAPFQAVFEQTVHLPSNSKLLLEWTPLSAATRQKTVEELVRVSFETDLDRTEHRMFLIRGGSMGAFFLGVSAVDLLSLNSEGKLFIHCPPQDLPHCDPEGVSLDIRIYDDIVHMAVGGVELFLSVTSLARAASKETASALLKFAGALAVVLAVLDLTTTILDLSQEFSAWQTFPTTFHTIAVAIALIYVASAAFGLAATAVAVLGGSAGTLWWVSIALLAIAVFLTFIAPIIWGPDVDAARAQVGPVLTQILNIKRLASRLDPSALSISADLHEKLALSAFQWASVADILGVRSIRDDFLWSKDYLETLQGTERQLAVTTPLANRSLNQTVQSFLFYQSQDKQNKIVGHLTGINSTKAEYLSQDRQGDFSFNASIYHRSPDSSGFVFDNSTLTYDENPQTIVETFGETDYAKLSSKNCDTTPVIGGCHGVGWAWDPPVENDAVSCLVGCPGYFAGFYTTDPTHQPAPGASSSHQFYLDKNPACGTITRCIDNGTISAGSSVLLEDINLIHDDHMKYVDSTGDGNWTPGETVVYDSDNNNTYDLQDALIAGAAPPLGTGLSSDAKITHSDTNNNSRFDLGETVVYDYNRNNQHDPGDRVIANLETFFLYKFYFDPSSTQECNPLACHISNSAFAAWQDQFKANLVALQPNLNALDTAIKSLNDARGRKRSSSLVTTFSDSIWIANSDEGTVSKLDTKTGSELGRYRTGPDNLAATILPTRTAVDQEGSVWVTNLFQSTATKIGLAETGKCQDRNHNEVIETSRDMDNDGKVTHGSKLVVGAQLTTTPGPEGGSPRLRFVDTNNNGRWDPGESVVFASLFYSKGDPVVYGPTPPDDTLTFVDSRILFLDENTDLFHSPHWDSYESVVYDSNNNGKFDANEPILASEILPWPSGAPIGLDECVVANITVGGPDSVPSAAVIDQSNNVWIGTCNEGKWYHFRGKDGTLLEPSSGIHVGGCPYGGLVDSNGILWGTSIFDSFVTRIDTRFLSALSPVGLPHVSYGIGIDSDGNAWVSGSYTGYVSRINGANVEDVRTFYVGPLNLRGIAVSLDNQVWVANGANLLEPGTLIHLDHDGVLIKSIPVGDLPAGVAIDADGKIWVTNAGSNNASRIDPSLDDRRGGVDGLFSVGAGPNNLGDMTGVMVRRLPFPLPIPIALSGISSVAIGFDLVPPTGSFKLEQGVHYLDTHIVIFDASNFPIPIPLLSPPIPCRLNDGNLDSKLDRGEVKASLSGCLTQKAKQTLASIIVDNQTRASVFSSAFNDLSTVVAFASAGNIQTSGVATSVVNAIVGSSKLSLQPLVGSVFEPRCGYLDLQLQLTTLCAGLGFPGSIQIGSFGKVDLAIADSNGLVVSKTINQIPGASYLEFDRNGDGQVDDLVVLPERRGISYNISIIREPSATLDDEFKLTISSRDVGFNLLMNTKMSDISPSGYTLLSEFLPVEAPAIPRNNPPMAVAGPTVTLEGNAEGGANIQLDGTGSSDPDGDPLTYSWFGDCGLATGPSPTMFCPWHPGNRPNTVQLVVNDGKLDSFPALFNVTVIDTTRPTITATRTPSDYWTNQTVTVSFQCADLVSGVSSASGPLILRQEGKNQNATGTCTDRAGNVASKTLRGINIDKTPPTINPSRTPPPNTNAPGWNNGNVIVHFECTDNLSGIASCPPDLVLTHEGRNQSVTGFAIDLAGNGASATIANINIDKTPPVITSAQEGQAFILHQAVLADAHCDDALSGVDTCIVPSGPLDTNTVGAHSYTITSTDRAGNFVAFTVHYDVHYVFIAVSPKPSTTRFQLGATIPVRFQLTDALGNFVSTARAQIWVDSPTTLGISSGSANTGNYFRYDSTDNQYVFNLSTRTMTGGLHTIYIALDDGTLHALTATLSS